MTEQICEHCRFWDSRYTQESYLGRCHRYAPQPINDTLIYMRAAIGLLLWWYIREHSDEERADEQLKTFNHDTEPQDPHEVQWPLTEAGETCGDWQERTCEVVEQAGEKIRNERTSASEGGSADGRSRTAHSQRIE